MEAFLILTVISKRVGIAAECLFSHQLALTRPRWTALVLGISGNLFDCMLNKISKEHIDALPIIDRAIEQKRIESLRIAWRRVERTVSAPAVHSPAAGGSSSSFATARQDLSHFPFVVGLAFSLHLFRART